MSKTDKELTAEIVCAYIEYWPKGQDVGLLQPDNVANLIKVVYKAIQGLPERSC